MKFLACLYGFKGSQSQMSAMLAFLLILGAIIDLLFATYSNMIYQLFRPNVFLYIYTNIIKKWYVFDLSCLTAGILEIAIIRGKIRNYFMIYGIRFFVSFLMMFYLVKSIIETFFGISHTTDIVYPIFVLMIVFVLNAKEYQLYRK